MNLIIVESPTKAKTISRFLGRGYKTASCFGHIRDLPEKEFGVEIEKNFKPKYIIPKKAREIIKKLKKEIENSPLVILATDEDREGEAIAWHLIQIFNLRASESKNANQKAYERIVFHEITKQAIEKALKNPRKIDIYLVNAQQARRILDRIVGYKLSPFLWKKVFRGLSAGRVQSVAVRLIVEREREIEKFVPQEYWEIEALLSKLKDKEEFTALLIKKNNKIIPKLGIKTKEKADQIIKDLKKAQYQIKKIEKKEVKRNPFPPFTTSTLQQTASKKFGWPPKKTMAIAQNLYERGYITYHRTDSLTLSQFALNQAKKFIFERFSKNYWIQRKYKTKVKVAQEAHEAIRPTYPEKEPENLKTQLEERQFKLYNLIWQRFIACQMKEAIFDFTKIEIEAKSQDNCYLFKTTGQILKFDGFLKVYPIKYQEKELPPLEKNESLKLKKLSATQHFTKPPPRYNEANLIRALEEKGIGRPSTYAPIISTIQERNYVKKDEKKFFRPTEIGTLVNDLLVEHFPKIVDLEFTAKMEEGLDEIAKGKEEWQELLRKFYFPFERNLKQKYEEVEKEKIIPQEKTDKICPKCLFPLLIRFGKFGKFYACSNFPKCKYTKPLEKPGLRIKCPRCKIGEIIEKTTKKGKVFYGCNNYPDCDFALWDKPTDKKCSECNSLLVEKGKQIKCSNNQCSFN
jgi:DNA topoisomerase-1